MRYYNVTLYNIFNKKVVFMENNIAFSGAIIASIIVLMLYYVCYRVEGKVINIMVPYIILTFPILYIFEMIYLTVTTDKVEYIGYLFFYSCYVISISSFVIFYLFSQRSDGLPHNTEKSLIKYNKYSLIAIFCTVLSLIVYLPVILEFKEYLLQPRRIYEQTRTGYGIYFYPSLVLSQIAILLSFYLLSKKKITAAVIILSNVALILLHGNKGPIFSMFMAYIMYASYVRDLKVRFMYLLVAGGFITCIVSAFFMYTFDNNNNVFINMAYYSDYTRNAVLLISKDWDFTYGRLLMESELYSRIPRALMESKPDDFGYLYLAKILYPVEFYRNQGAPAFGYGEYYADFGWFTPIYLAVSGALKGILAKFFANKLKKNKNIYIFIIFLFFAGVGIIPVSMGWLFPEHLFIAVMLYLALNTVMSSKYKLVLLRNRNNNFYRQKR